MSEFKVGQRVKCVFSNHLAFAVGSFYSVAEIISNHTMVMVGDDGRPWGFGLVMDMLARFEPASPKFTAVSGDQSLFDLVGAADDEYHIIKSGRCVLSVCYITPADLVIAERKPYVEKYVPKVGESFRVGGILYRDANIFNNGSVSGFSEIFGCRQTVLHHSSTKFERP